MFVQQVFSNRGRSLVAAVGIVAVVAFNGIGGGVAGAQNAPATSGCVTLPAGQGTGTTVLPADDASATPSTTEGANTAPSSDSAESAPTLEVTQGSFDTQGCAVQIAGTAGQTISIQVCISQGGAVVQSFPVTGAPITGETTDGKSAEQGAATAPETATPQAGTEEAGTSTGAAAGDSTLTVAPGAFVTTGSGISTGSTCVSVSVTNGQPTILVPGVTLQPVPGGLPAEGDVKPGEAVPAQPGATTAPSGTPEAGQ